MIKIQVPTSGWINWDFDEFIDTNTEYLPPQVFKIKT